MQKGKYGNQIYIYNISQMFITDHVYIHRTFSVIRIQRQSSELSVAAMCVSELILSRDLMHL